jgi:hypothetical protein
MNVASLNIIYTILNYFKPNHKYKIANSSKNIRLYTWVIKSLANRVLEEELYRRKYYEELSNDFLYDKLGKDNEEIITEYKKDLKNNFLNYCNCEFNSFKTDKQVLYYTIFNDLLVCGHNKGFISVYDLNNYKLMIRKNSHFFRYYFFKNSRL